MKQLAVTRSKALAAALRDWIPIGGSLPEPTWRDRHHAIVVLLYLHALGIAAFGLLAGQTALHSLTEGGLVALTAALAAVARGGRPARSGIATVGLVLSSALLVHASGGYVEFHFHFFVMVIVVSLYEDWVPFLLAIGFVVLEHGVVGVLDPTAVYNHPDAWAHPWKWAAIHGAFVIAASAASIAAWRLNEIVRSRYHLILDAAGDGIYGVDRAGRITFVNAAAARLLGRGPLQLVGQPEAAIAHQIASDMGGESPGQATIASGAARRAVGRVLRRLDGATAQIDYVSAPVRERGALVGAVVAFQDVSERARAEEALRESEERLRRIIATALDAVVAADEAGRVTEWNVQAEAIFGWSRAEAIGRDALDLIVPARLRDRCAPGVAELLVVPDGPVRNRRVEITAVRRDGRELPVEVSVVGVPIGHGRAVSMFLRDVTDRRLAEQHAAHLAHTEKLRALGQMASGIAHDLNQSLALVAGYADLAREAIEGQSPDLAGAATMMDAVARAAMDGGETVKRLLMFARQRENTPAEVVDVHELLAEVARLTAPRWRDLAQAEGRTITIHLDVDPTTTIDGHAPELRQAMTNLIFNAVDAMPSGGTLTLSARRRAERVEIGVADTGAGMRPEVQARIFEPFFTTKGERGSGLGLAQVFGIAERHAGTVSVNSAAGQGTAFTLSFPESASTTPSLAPVAPVAIERVAAAIDRTLRVLAVDDDADLREMAAAALRRRGSLVTTAASAEEALTHLGAESFDVVVSDLGLGEGMNGWELAARVRERWGAVRFVLATGWGSGLDAAAARARGVHGVVAKPYRLAELEAAVAATLEAP